MKEINDQELNLMMNPMSEDLIHNQMMMMKEFLVFPVHYDRMKSKMNIEMMKMMMYEDHYCSNGN
jgi:hypothetical protein